MFTRTGTVWSQEAYIKASNTDVDDGFFMVALEGDTLVVGASYEDSAATGVNGNQADDSATGSGAVYVFSRANGMWSQIHKGFGGSKIYSNKKNENYIY